MSEQTTKKLKLFNERVNRLKENKDFFVNISISSNFRKVKNTKESFKGPDPKTVKAFLLDFRFFIANKEQINFNHICNLIAKEISNYSIKQKSKKARNAWNKLLHQKNSSSRRNEIKN